MSTAVPDFASYPERVRQIFKAYNSYDDRTEHGNIIKARPEIDSIFKSIPEHVEQQTSFEAKQQALMAAIEIAGDIFNESERSLIGRDIREDLPYMPLSTAIDHVLDMLLPEELAALQADGEIPKALRKLRWHAAGYSLDLDIDDSIDRLWLEESDQEDDAHVTL
jgi:hypothetical protein